MIRSVLFVMVVLAMGCATSPEMKLRDQMTTEIYWDSARECESRFPMLHLDRVAREGDLTVGVEALQTQDVPRFAECYWGAIGKRVERRRLANLPLPDPLVLKPAVDYDLGGQ
jgi:hypothetical protein